MGRESAGVDFALIGHADRWEKLFRILEELRDPQLPRVSESDLKDLLPWIPPRTVMRLRAKSDVSKSVVNGIYIETFITPDQLAAGSFKSVVEKIRYAAQTAVREGARIAALGGFTSIALETEGVLLDETATAFTTGNTLTAAYIVKGVEAAARRLGREISQATILIIGATGDVGSGCARYFSRSAKRILLVARNPRRLEALSAELRTQPAEIECSTDLGEFLGRSEIVISAASLAEPSLNLGPCPPNALICDAGYPRNVDARTRLPSQRLFFGGMGYFRGRIHYEPDLRAGFYEFPSPGIIHGCLMEAALLALEGRVEPFSQGRGNISPEKIQEIWAMAEKHGFELAPFFNGEGLWEF